MQSLIGVAFGSYVVVEKLGEGRLATMYKAYQEGLGRTIAIKAFHAELSRDPEFLEQLRRRILDAAKLSHPNILHIYSAGVAHGTCFVAMDLALGGSLKAKLQGGRVDIETAISIAGQLADAVDYAHGEGVVHGDIRAENVLMTRDGRPLLADFGIAPALEGAQREQQLGGRFEEPEDVDATKGPVGRARRGKDLQALGAVLFEMLVGVSPPSEEAGRAGHDAGPSRTESAVLLAKAGVPEWLAAIVDRALSSSASAGYSRASELAGDLERRKAPDAGQASAGRHATRSRPSLRNWRAVVAAVVSIVGVGLALAVAVMFYTRDGGGSALDVEPASDSATVPTASRVRPTATAAASLASPSLTATRRPVSTAASVDLTSTLAAAAATVTLAPVRGDTETAVPSSTVEPPVPGETATRLGTGTLPPSTTESAETRPTPEALKGTIAFSAYDADMQGYKLYLYELGSGELRAIGDYAHQPEFRPDGERLVVDGLGGGRDDLWSLAVDGSDWFQMTRHPDDQFPTWLPDGSGIAFSSTRQGDGVYRLYVNDELMRTSVTHQITGDYPVMLPTWDVAFSGCNYGWGDGSKCGLWIVKAGAMPYQLTGDSRDIATDATGQEVLFLRPSEANWDVYRVSREGGDVIRLTSHPGRDGPAAFSPDGQHIAYLSEQSGNWALYTATRTGRRAKLILDLPQGGGLDSGPSPWLRERISWGP